jgi:hypothetical protein
MQKKLFMFIILVSFIFYSCLDYSLPEKVELEVEGSINLPVKISTSNWGSVVIEKLKESLSGWPGLEIYDVNYSGQNVQAFCCVYSYEMSQPFDPDEYLDEINALTKFGGLEALKLDYSIPIPSFDNIPFNCPTVPIPIVVLPGITSIPFSEAILIDIPEFNTNLNSINADFLHAKIGAGSLTVNLVLSPENIILPPLEFIYDLHLSQTEYNEGELGKHPGLNYPDPSKPESQTSGEIDLTDQYINKQEITIRGTVTLKPKSADSFFTIIDPNVNTRLTGKLDMQMNINNIAEIDLNFEKITDELKDKLQPNSISLDTAARYLNWISFDEPESIGIKLTFSEETSETIIEGLAMSVECTTLDFNDEQKDLVPGSNMFGNEEKFTLYLANNENAVDTLDFNITLHPSGNSDKVLHLTNLVPGEELKIKGEPELVLDWTKAEVKTQKILEAAGQGEDLFAGEFPDTKHIDLSISDEYNGYFDGFEFMQDRLNASVYLSGPDKMIKSIEAVHPTLSLKAQYNEKTLPLMNGTIELDEKRVDIAADDDYTYKDKNGNIIYKRNGLPHASLENFEFVDILNTRPADLFFQYDISLPSTIEVEPSMFEDDNDNKVDPKIAVTIIILIHLELKAGDNGGWIKPGMFKDQIDLLGRKTPGENSMFTSLSVSYINVAVDLAGAFFTDGNLFIEKDPVLFPTGIPMNGTRIAVNITDEKLGIIKKQLINPDFRFEFGEKGKIAIPKNIGLTSVKIEAKGKNTLLLDF